MTPTQRLVAPEARLRATLLAEVSEAMPPRSPDMVTEIESASSPPPMRLMSGSFQSSSFTFSHIIKLPKDFRAPVIETMANVGNRDHRKSRENIPL